MRTILKLISVMTILLSIGPPVMAQGPPGTPGPPEGRMRERVRERIKTIKVWKLTEELKLSQEQSEKFFPIYNRFFNRREEIEQEKRRVMEQLDELTAAEKPNEAEISKCLDKIDGMDQEIQQLKVKFRADLKNILTARQIGRLYLFEVRFMQQMQEIMRDIRRETKAPHFGREPGE